jgi:hypothetical protein
VLYTAEQKVVHALGPVSVTTSPCNAIRSQKALTLFQQQRLKSPEMASTMMVPRAFPGFPFTFEIFFVALMQK